MNDMFVGEMSLKHWVTESLPYELIEVMDANLLISKKEREHCAIKRLCIVYFAIGVRMFRRVAKREDWHEKCCC